MTSPFSFRLEQPSDASSIDALHAALFSPDWVKRAAYVLRDGVPADLDLSFVAAVDGRLVASVRMTPITIGNRPALNLGPLVVSPELKGQGAGRALVRMALEAARTHGHQVVLLVGDLPYYGPLGFTFLGRDVITLPAWVDPDRVLVAGLQPGALDGLRGAAMRTIELNAANWKKTTDFYDALLAALGAPEWHGYSVNALEDSMIWTDQINAMKPPYAVRIIGAVDLPRTLKAAIAEAEQGINDARAAYARLRGRDVEVTLESDVTR